MKINTLFLTLILSVSFFSLEVTQAKSVIQTKSSSQTVTFDMQNMTCTLCEFTIKKALQGVEGVQKVDVNSDTKTAVVTYNPQKTTLKTLIEATTYAGYPATVRQEK